MVSEVSDPIRSVRLCPECPIVSDCVRKCPECPIVSDLKLGKLDISMHDPVQNGPDMPDNMPDNKEVR